MYHRVFHLFAFFVGLSVFNSPLYSADTINAPSTNIQFPSEVSYNLNGKDISLHATGVATRSKFFVNVYSIVHYMRHPVQGKRNVVFDEILNDNQTKQVTLHWVRDVNLDKMRDGFDDSMRKALRDNPADVDQEIDQFLSMFNNNIQSGDIHTIRWLPGGKVEVEVNGEAVGTINNPDFARTLWAVWFGPKSVVSRNRLIALVKTK